MYFPEIFIKR